MNSRFNRLVRRYTTALVRYLADGREARLEEAFEVGRSTMAGGLGVLDLVRIHEKARTEMLRVSPPGLERAESRRAALEAFFLQALSPFEAAHRGFRETNLKLKRLIATLKNRNTELAQTNSRLEVEFRKRERTEHALQVSEGRLQAILDHSPAVIFLKNLRGRYLLVNRRFEKLFGLRREEIVGRTDRELFPREQAGAFSANDRAVLRAGGPLEFEEVARYRDGIHVSIVSKFPLRNARGDVYALCGIATDITGRKRIEEDLRQSEERFRLLVANVRNYAIFLLQPDGRVASWNAGAQRIYGYGEQEIVGRHFSSFSVQSEFKKSRARRALQTALREGRYEEEGWRVRRDGSHFWANAVIAPVHDGSGRLRGFAKVIRDMTERRRTEEALRRSEEHYRQLFKEAQAMQESLRNLSSQILHVQEEERKNISRELHDEVGQHLTAVSVMLATLRNNGVHRTEELAQRIAGTQRLLEVTMETVHNFARELRPAILDDLGLLPALRSSLNAFAARTGLRVRLRGSVTAEKLGNEQKTVLFRVVQESLTNVAKHAQASRVDVVLRKADDGIAMEIADNGKSFRDDPRSSVRFRQRLGLLGMQERVRLVNGRFNIRPDPGKGTTVQVVIPFKATGRLGLTNHETAPASGTARGVSRPRRAVRLTAGLFKEK
jgi:PAS domain S-box-containing protein